MKVKIKYNNEVFEKVIQFCKKKINNKKGKKIKKDDLIPES